MAKKANFNRGFLKICRKISEDCVSLPKNYEKRRRLTPFLS